MFISVVGKCERTHRKERGFAESMQSWKSTPTGRQTSCDVCVCVMSSSCIDAVFLALVGKTWFSGLSLMADRSEGKRHVLVDMLEQCQLCLEEQAQPQSRAGRSLAVPYVTHWVLDTQLYSMFCDLAFPVQALF